jgi:signal transduction histidine kinase
MVAVHPVQTPRPWQGYVYFAGLLVFIAVLTLRSPWFAFFTWIGFLHAGQYLKGAWRWVGCAGVAIFFAMAQAGGFHRPTTSLVAIWVLLACVDVFLIGVFTLLGVKVGEQNEARKHMIAELAEANHRLEEMIAENTGLQAQLLTQAREAGAGDERQRMAREIQARRQRPRRRGGRRLRARSAAPPLTTPQASCGSRSGAARRGRTDRLISPCTPLVPRLPRRSPGPTETSRC